MAKTEKKDPTEDVLLFRFLTSLAIKLGIGTIIFSFYFFVYREQKNSWFTIFFIFGIVVFIIGLIGRWSTKKR